MLVINLFDLVVNLLNVFVPNLNLSVILKPFAVQLLVFLLHKSFFRNEIVFL